VEHIAFEDHVHLPSTVSRHLEQAGYAVFALIARPTSPTLSLRGTRTQFRDERRRPTSRQSVRCIWSKQLRPWGWRCLLS
jgi:hypothetical protein